MLAAGALAAWLFFLKVRPPRVAVPSLLLWRRVLDEQRELTWWERIRRAVSLAATVLMPPCSRSRSPGRARASAATTRGRLLIVLDSSWSMLARTRAGETRWDRARRRRAQLAASAGGDDVALATTAGGLVEGPTSDLALIETALDELTPQGGESDAWPRVAGADASHFITDGAVARPLDPRRHVHSVYEAAPNVAIIAFEVRPATAAARQAQAYLEIANYAPQPQPRTLHDHARHGRRARSRRSISPPAIVGRQVVPLEPHGRRAAARPRERAGQRARDRR